MGRADAWGKKKTLCLEGELRKSKSKLVGAEDYKVNQKVLGEHIPPPRLSCKSVALFINSQ